MNCTDVRKHWMFYLDSEGDAELHLQIRDHLGGCAACATLFAEQHWLEQRVNLCLAAGELTPELWTRVLRRTGLEPHAAGLLTRLLRPASFLAAAVVLLAAVVGLLLLARSPSNDLLHDALGWHERRQSDHVRPDLASGSEQEIDRYLKTHGVACLRCPGGADVDFRVGGAGVCTLGGHDAVYVVGLMGDADISILALDQPPTQPRQKGTNEYTHGAYRALSSIVGDRLVIITGTASFTSLERLLQCVRRLAIAADDFPREKD